MNKTYLIILILLVISCKTEKKSSSVVEIMKETTKSISEKEPVIKDSLILPRYNLWVFNRLDFVNVISNNNIDELYRVSRNSIQETAYALVNEIPVKYGSKYRLSIIVKQGDVGSLFGLRAIGQYPNRIDAVFDLNKGDVKGNKSSGDFNSGEVNIKPLKNGWFKCSIVCEFDTDMLKIIFGPTSGLGKVSAWEAKTNDFCDMYVQPSSLTLEEISN